MIASKVSADCVGAYLVLIMSTTNACQYRAHLCILDTNSDSPIAINEI